MTANDMVDKTIWIIGASAGIGRALAICLARDRARLVLSARDEESLEALARELDGEHRVVPLDISRRESLEAAAETIGPVDMIILLAALYDPGDVLSIAAADAEQLIAVNILGNFHVAQLAPTVLRDGGQLVLFGSVAGYIGLPRGQLYSASKAAIANLAESLYAEWYGRYRVRLVSPGFVETRLTARNRFTMPAIISAEEAADAVVKGLAGQAFEIHFPKRFTIAVKFLRLLPYAVSLPLIRRFARGE